jgi:hypothetical protein
MIIVGAGYAEATAKKQTLRHWQSFPLNYVTIVTASYKSATDF